MSTSFIPLIKRSLILFQDNFNRGAGVNELMGPNWDVESFGGVIGVIINNNFARGNGGGGRAFVSTSVGSFGVDQYVQYTPQQTVTGKIYDWYLRGGAIRMVMPMSNTAFLTLRVYGATPFDTGIVPSVFDTIRLEAVGEAFKIRINGSIVYTGTVPGSAVAGQPGFRMSINIDADDFEAGEL